MVPQWIQRIIIKSCTPEYHITKFWDYNEEHEYEMGNPEPVASSWVVTFQYLHNGIEYDAYDIIPMYMEPNNYLFVGQI